MINIQPVEGLSRDKSDLDVHGVFYTIQGEGPHCGRPAVFARLAGCNLQCPGCDTDYTSRRARMSSVALADLIFEAESDYLCRHGGGSRRPALVVITGGEPFRQNIAALTHILINRGYDVQVETNGTLAPPLQLHPATDIVLSPKMGRVHPRTAMLALAWKYVLSAGAVSPDDGLPLQVLGLDPGSQGRVARPPQGVRVYLQPADSGNPEQNAANLEACIQSCLTYDYTLQLQIHKLINME